MVKNRKTFNGKNDKMIRSRSVSSRSSAITGDSLQMSIEGQWDETVSIEDIHKGVLYHLTEKLDGLKRKYMSLKNSKGDKNPDRLIRKIVIARINYQRYLNVTKEVLGRCRDFMQNRRDTPTSRIAFIRNAQDYFLQAKDFIKMDITLRKLSPTLINYVKPKSTDSPGTYRAKRDMCRAMAMVVGADKGCTSNSSAGKIFRSRYAQQTKFLHTDFPDSWIQYLPVVLREVITDKHASDQRWLYTVLYIFSKHCSANYLQQGFCPSCMFPIVSFRERGIVGGKLFCYACRKEIEWTYYMNPRTICIILTSFHENEIFEAKRNIVRFIDGEYIEGDIDGYFEEVLREYIQNPGVYMEPPNPKPSKTSLTKDNTCEPYRSEIEAADYDEEEDDEKEGDDDDKEEKEDDEKEGDSNPQRVSSETSSTPLITEVMKKVVEKMQAIKLPDGKVMPRIEDFKNIKETYSYFKSEIACFEGKVIQRFPRGIVSRVERYVCHYYKLPPADDVKKLPFNAKGDREGTSRKMIDDALTELSLSKWSSSTSRIANKLWGSKIPNMRKHHVDILADCILQKEVFGIITTHGRKSNISQRLILMYIARRYGYPWDETDFRVNFNPSTIARQILILNEVFSIIDQNVET